MVVVEVEGGGQGVGRVGLGWLGIGYMGNYSF